MLLYVLFDKSIMVRSRGYIYQKGASHECINIIGPRCEKTCLQRCANNKGADQPAHPRRLISTFVIRLLKSIISRLATSEISISS